MDVQDALAQISEIRQHLFRTTVFRGYRAATTAFTAAVAVAAAAVQASFVDPRDRQAVLSIWLAAAALSLLVVGVEVAARCVLRAGAVQREQAFSAMRQLVPCLVGGALLTYVIETYVTNAFWMLPGLWAILFSLGLFSSRPMLPRGVTFVAAYYLLTGLCAIVQAAHDRVFSAGAMAVSFGVGQALAAVMLYLSLERGNARE